MLFSSLRFGIVLGVAAALSACAPDEAFLSVLADPPEVQKQSDIAQLLHEIPAPTQPVVVAVYGFEDKTGQHKPSDSFPEYSRAVTQGGAALLSKALYDAGGGKWFTVLEREGLNNLAQERKIVRATREEYAMPDGRKLDDIGPMMYAGVLVEGGIVAYDTDTITGGLGARYLGIGANTKYRRDVVTVALRLVSVKSGQILLAVNTTKTIFLTSIDANTYRYTALDSLLQIESGITVNEPPQFATQQAIELAVYAMIMEGASRNLWAFADSIEGAKLLARYRANSKSGQAMTERKFIDTEESEPPQMVRPQELTKPDPQVSLTPQALPQMQFPAQSRTPLQVEPIPVPSNVMPVPQNSLPEERVVTLPSDETLRRHLEQEISRGMQGESVQRGKVVCGVNGCVPTSEAP